jgi:hypothetical protein
LKLEFLSFTLIKQGWYFIISEFIKIILIFRELDAGQLMIGHDVNPSLLVPPNTDDFVVAGHCSSECTNQFPEGGLTVFNSLLHSHLSGRKLKIRQFRDGQEQIWPDFDNHYDFDYQQNRHLSKPFKILKGDHLTYGLFYLKILCF